MTKEEIDKKFPLTIKIIGPCASGRSTLIRLIHKILKDSKWIVYSNQIEEHEIKTVLPPY